MTIDDMELVRQYVGQQSESAFATIVSRHASLVYSAALRSVRDPHLAEEVTQAVFIILARKAGSFDEKTILSGWLYRTSCYTASSARKQQQRRQQREQEAYMQATPQATETEAAWKQISPLLEEAMLKLGQADRDALLLRFFEGRSLQEVGTALGASEDAAKKRIRRALEKLQRYFCRRGVSSTTAIVAGALAANSVQAAPATLATSVTAAALAKGAAASGSTLTLIKGALNIMAWTKAKTITAVALAAIVGTTATTVAVKELGQPKPAMATNPGDWIWRPYAQSFDRVPPMFLLRPSTLPTATAPFDYMTKDGYLARGKSVKELITTIWSQKNSAMKLVFAADLPGDKLDFIAKSQPRWWNRLESEINQQFNLVEQTETRETGPVVVVKKAN